MIKPTIKNLTSVSVDICKACTKSQTIPPNVEMPIITTLKSFCHGHSSIGSFIIARYGEKDYDYKAWGNIELRLITTIDSCTFEITEKK